MSSQVQSSPSPYSSSPDDSSTGSNVSFTPVPKKHKTSNKKRGGRKLKEKKLRAAAANQPPLYEVKDTGTRGFGLFATQDIPAGTRILDEEPLFTISCGSGMGDMILTCFRNLPFDVMDQYMTLHSRHVPDEEYVGYGYGNDGEDLPGSDDSTTHDYDNDYFSPNESGEPLPFIPRGIISCDAASISSGYKFINVFADLDLDADTDVHSDAGANVHPDAGNANIELAKSHHRRHDSAAESGWTKDQHTKMASSSDQHHDSAPPTGNLCYTNDLGVNQATPSHQHHDFTTKDNTPDPNEITYDSQDIINIFETNALGSEINNTPFAILCLTAARLNHSCIPNVFCALNTSTNRHTVHALRDIRSGEELCNSYIIGHLKTSGQRQSELAKWGFRCTCRACGDKISESDARRKRLSDLQNSAQSARNMLLSGQLSAHMAQDAVFVLTEMVRLMEEEGLLGPDLGDLCGAVALCSFSTEETLFWWARKLEILLRCYGHDGACFVAEARAFRSFFVDGGGLLEDLPGWMLLG